jgi:hypothetical protein
LRPTPLDSWILHSDGARRVCRFISKYVIGYFPVTLHVEDYGAFDSNRAYGELILTISFPFWMLESSYLTFSVDSIAVSRIRKKTRRAPKWGGP